MTRVSRNKASRDFGRERENAKRSQILLPLARVGSRTQIPLRRAGVSVDGHGHIAVEVAADDAAWVGNLLGVTPNLQAVCDAVDGIVGGGGGGAPTTAQYLTGAADAGLSAERVVTDTASMAWDLATAGQAKVNAQFGTGAGSVCQGNDSRLSDARTPTAHTHVESDVTGLVTDLAGKANATHTHTTGDISGLGTAATADSADFEPVWLKVKKTSDFSTTSTTPQRTGLAFTVVASKAYRVAGEILMRSSDTTTAPKLSFSWPTGMEDGSISIKQPNAVNVEAMRHIRIEDTTAVAITSIPTDANSYSYSCFISGLIVCGGSASGDIELMLSSEVSGNTVYVKKWSNLRVQEIV